MGRSRSPKRTCTCLAATCGGDFGRRIQPLPYQDRHSGSDHVESKVGCGSGNIALAAGSAGLDRDSVINVSQVVTLDKSDLITRLGTLDGLKTEQVDAGLRLALAL